MDYFHRTYSHNLTENVGRSDGEGPERGWLRNNRIAKSTTEMGPGSRRDTLNNRFNDDNYKKTKTIRKQNLFIV